MKHYIEDKEAVLKQLSSSVSGLSEDEAQKRLAENGKNSLAEGKKESIILRFLKQLSDPMIIVLIAAAAVSAVTAMLSGESFTDVFIILFVVIVNAVLGVLQESKAEKAIDALKKMSAATSRVLRNGNMKIVKSEELVVGDIILLEAGDAVPADARIIESASLKAEESALTGESVPVNKSEDKIDSKSGEIPLGDRTNMLYSSSTIAYGRAKAVVTAVGMDTEVGKIADAISSAQNEQTPLQKKLSQLSKILTFVVLGICIFIFGFSILKAGHGNLSSVSSKTVLDTFVLAVSLAVAAIPEGLAAVVTIVLSMGVTKMSKRNAVIRKLTAVETLGCTQIICSDKTGTLTQNKMTVVEEYSSDKTLLAKGMALCCDAELNEQGKAEGEPTECALVQFAADSGFLKPDLKNLFPRVGEAPFDSKRKMMSTLHKPDINGIVQFTKGAPDVVISKCTHILENGEINPLSEQKKAAIEAENKNMADKALRVLALAMKKYPEMPESTAPESIETDMVFVGLVGMIDPVRPEVVDAIVQCKKAGIRPVMITGDHLDTAIAIAKTLGIITDSTQGITGAELDKFNDEELKELVTKFSVYARVQPEHKVRIVKAWKQNGMITAMTGDGVNDAPSIKSADIGVGMGITGTDVTKNVADMVLADDNFATIVSAVGEGRRIYDNIRKSIQFLLASNMSEVLTIFTATMIGFTVLKPVHLLWINLITDCFPALALGMEKSEANVMERPPRKSKDGIFAGGMGFDILYQGVISTLIVLASYLIGHHMENGVWEFVNSPDGMTMAFLTMSMMEIFHSINMRSQRGSLFKMKGINIPLLIAMIASFLLTTAVIYVPFLSNLFGFEQISLKEYAVAIALAFTIIPLVEIVKLIQRACRKGE